MKIVGYGICGPGEADKYLEQTLKEFQRLCDEVIILGNNITNAERLLIQLYGYRLVEDNREWGINQWKIKQDFVETHVSKLVTNGDMLVCLDMDEVFCKHLTKDWIKKAPLDAYHVFIVDLWDDGYKPESCFWNVRLWRWNGDTKWKQKPVHCGLAPAWTYYYHRFAPFILKHSGLKEKHIRKKKIERYEKYDPKAQYLDKKYYDMLQSDTSKPFNEEILCKVIETEVDSYKQTVPREKPMPKTKKYAYVMNSAGITNDVPVDMLDETLRQPGMKFIGFVEDANKEIAEMFLQAEKVEVKAEPVIEIKKRGRPKKTA